MEQGNTCFESEVDMVRSESMGVVKDGHEFMIITISDTILCSFLLRLQHIHVYLMRSMWRLVR